MSNELLSETADILKIGENTYTKLKYSPLKMSEIASIYIRNIANDKSDELEKMYSDSLRKVYVNGESLDNDLKINNHFSKFPSDIREVRIWALMEGLQSFLASFNLNPNLESKYFKN